MRTRASRDGRGERMRQGAAYVDVRALAGSALLWSWVDNLYMSSFFAPFGQRGMMPELATWTTFLLLVPLAAILLCSKSAAKRMVTSQCALVCAGALGSLGSALFAVSAHLSSFPLMFAATIPAALFMASSILAWGVVYCEDGARSAVTYVAGGFALALLPDVTFLSMAAPVSGIAPIALPALANLLLLTQDISGKLGALEAHAAGGSASCAVPDSGGGATASAGETGAAGNPGGAGGLAGFARLHLGISMGPVASMALVMFGLGYMQHNISFTNMLGAGGPLLDVARGIASAALLLFTIAGSPGRSRVAYAIGLLAIVAGFSLMPFLYGTDWFWLCGVVNIAGYASFDVLIWVIVAQAAYTGLGRPLRLICVMRLLVSSAFSAAGGFVSMGLSLLQTPRAPFAFADAIFMGYLMTIAVVLILDNSGVWELLSSTRPVEHANDSAQGASSFDLAVARLSKAWGLTDREREVFSLLVLGRTQPWVAERLGISESTVNSHVRHIYGKAGVNSRQELLDLVLSAQSPESIDIPDLRR
jgi:DNA-binding CsgD family transcriptional regulator